MSKKQAWAVKHIATILILGAACALPAAAVTCPPDETPASKGASTCVKLDAPKTQLDASTYAGAQKKEAEVCNKLNTAQGTVMSSSTEISRINTSLDEAYFAQKKASTDADKAAADAEVKKWKDLRTAEEAKLKTAKTNVTAGKKELRAATKAVKKEKKESLNCA